MTVLLVLAITLGIRHAFEPDHIAAVLCVSTESNSMSATAKQGAIWGIGHTITLLFFSMILMGLQIEIDKSVFVFFELVIGIALVWMGIDVIKKAKILFSTKENNYSSTVARNNKAKLTLKSLGIGLLHGAAGSGLIVALITTTIDSIYLKFTYIVLFSIGLIICMSFLSILMTMPLHRRIRFIPFRYFKVVTGTLAIVVGMKMLYSSSTLLNMLPI